jgi:hypothetical protein
MDASAAVDVRGLTKSYRDVRAVAGIDLRITRVASGCRQLRDR